MSQSDSPSTGASVRRRLYLAMMGALHRLDPPGLYCGFEQPIFIIAPPRSGSTFLFECLSQSLELCHLNRESDSVWWRVFPYESMEEPSDYVGADCASGRNIRAVRRHIYALLAASRCGANSTLSRLPDRIPFLLGVRRIRYVDKTIANCFHLEFLERAFPDAKYVLLVRDPRDTISSMIDAWPHAELVGKPQLTTFLRDVHTASIDHWSYPAPPGWLEVVSWPLPRICAWSWHQHLDFALALVDRHPNQVITVRYEDLDRDTVGTVSGLSEKLGLQLTERMTSYALASPTSRTTISAPRRDKWAATNREQILSILPMIKVMAKRIGYDLSSE